MDPVIDYNDIVWLRDPTEFAFLRRTQGFAANTKSKPRKDGNVVVGYVKNYRKLSPYMYLCDYFHIRELDLPRKLDEEGNLIDYLPCEGVMVKEMLQNKTPEEIEELKSLPKVTPADYKRKRKRKRKEDENIVWVQF